MHSETETQRQKEIADEQVLGADVEQSRGRYDRR